MKVLVLTGKFGMGHFKCAEAIKERIERENPDAEVTVVDIIQYLFPRSNKLIYRTFNILVTNLSKMYNYLNKVAERYKGVPLKNSVARKLDRLVEKYEPDRVIANLPISVQYFSAYKEKRHKDIPLYVYITDIYVHVDWVAPYVDAYFVGDEASKETLVSKGISCDRIHTTGIPVSEAFKAADYGVDDGEKSKILIMGGGLGLIPGGHQVLDILDNADAADVTLVCGKNKRLYNKAKREYKNINVLGFVDNVPEMMAQSDMIITKPGGITTFEAIQSETPLYVLHPTLDQELGNAKFIEKNNIGKIVYNMDNFSEESLLDFVMNKECLNKIKENMKVLASRFESMNPLAY